MRDRLIELVSKAREKCNLTSCCDCEYRDDESLTNCYSHLIADQLLESGVIVPPVKVGDTVYYLGGIHKSLVKSATVEEIIASSNGVSDLLVNSENGVTFENSVDIFYFTPEEAEQALKGEHHG